MLKLLNDPILTSLSWNQVKICSDRLSVFPVEACKTLESRWPLKWKKKMKKIIKLLMTWKLKSKFIASRSRYLPVLLWVPSVLCVLSFLAIPGKKLNTWYPEGSHAVTKFTDFTPWRRLGESTRLPLMGAGLASEFDAIHDHVCWFSNLLRERFFPSYSGFPLKINIWFRLGNCSEKNERCFRVFMTPLSIVQMRILKLSKIFSSLELQLTNSMIQMWCHANGFAWIESGWRVFCN